MERDASRIRPFKVVASSCRVLRRMVWTHVPKAGGSGCETHGRLLVGPEKGFGAEEAAL